MNIDNIVATLKSKSTLAVESSPQLVDKVYAYAKEQAGKNEAYRYGKHLTPLAVGPGVRTSPAEVLHELGVATTLLDATPLAQVARHWAHLRYCATLTTQKGHLALSKHAASVVYHHKVTQSEQLGIGLALVVAKTLLRRQHPGWDFHAVDAEVALKAGFLDGVGAVRTASQTKKRPDYILVGHHSSGRRSRVRIVVLECKGTHQSSSFASEQLARAAVQVNALRVGGRRQSSLMVASCLSEQRITSYVLDPPSDDELWSGADGELDDLVGGSPEDQNWQPQPAPDDDAATWEIPADAATPTEDTTVAPDEDLPRERPKVLDVPAEQRGWLTQILTRAAAATALLFAGNNAAARVYTTTRQRGEQPAQEGLFELESPWELSTARTLPLATTCAPKAPTTGHRCRAAGRWRFSEAWTPTSTGTSPRAGSAPTCETRHAPPAGGRPPPGATTAWCRSAGTAQSSSYASAMVGLEDLEPAA